MEIYVACDVCGHRYVMTEERTGRTAKCKSCGVAFEVGPENYYDPETSELDEPAASEEEESSGVSLWTIASRCGHGVAGLVTAGILVWMVTLVFRSPREAAAFVPSQVAARRASLPSPSPSPNPMPQFRVNPPQVGRQPSVPSSPPFSPSPTPFGPPQGPFSPPRFPNPARGVPESPAMDGSMGWPKSEPDTAPSTARPVVQPTPRPNRRSEQSDLSVGQIVEVQKDGEWIAAIIRRVEPGGMIRVHYRGRSQGDDESVPRDRVRTK
ncbi:MAG: hypothetical protein E6Q76_04550 [Rhizobium sp.]|nr:MAG: hypothetical protein E6Q76_04550 [Rhizobium sp.]